MKTLLSTICAIFISLSIYGQTDFFKFKTISSEDCNFPIFTSSVDTLTYNKINQTLQLLKLNLLEGFQTKTIFEEIRFTDFVPKATISRQMEFEILENNNKTLTIYFNEASCYATCFYWNSYLNFNSQNGNLINIEELFTKEGFENFKQIVKNKNIKHIINQSLSIEKEYRTSFINTYSNLISNADINDFYIKHDTIVIDRWNFLDKNTKVSGMNLITKYSISEFKNHLNEYGNYIFSTLNNKNNFNFITKSKLYKGTIADENILLFIEFKENNKIEGKYTYLKYGKALDIDGEIIDNKITLRESNKEGETTGYLAFVITEDKITGTWSNEDKSKNYNIYATEK